MSKLGVVFLLMVLVLTPVMPMAASPHRGPATKTPTPVVSATETPTPISREETCAELLNLDEDSFFALFWASEPVEVPDPETAEAMEEFRRELLGLVDVLDELFEQFDAWSVSPATPLSDERNLAMANRQRIQEVKHEIEALTPGELYLLRKSFITYKVLKDSVESLESLVLTPAKESGEEEGLGPSLGSFTVVPTPTPGVHGIDHMMPEPIPGPNGLTGRRDNLDAGDIWVKETGPGDENPTPKYPLPMCSRTRPHNVVQRIAQTQLSVAKLAAVIANNVAEPLLAVCPVPGGTNVPQWILKNLADLIVLAFDYANEWVQFCVGSIDSREIEAGFQNTTIIHADLMDHDDNLVARANAIDQFLFDFRNLNLRLNIEANLASPDDDPNSLFALPSHICIKEDPQPGEPFAEIIAPEPIVPLTQETLRRCGLLEVVRDTVRSTIDMNQIAGQDINNAEAEFDAAVAHYDAQQWKLAYARFRKAYREAVRP